MALAKSLTTTWHVPADKPFVGFPLCPGTYFNSANLDIKIDWGDGQEDEITDSTAGAARTVFHKYDAAGDKVITVYGGYGTNDNDRKIAFPSFDDRAVSHFGPSRTVSTMERLKKVTTWENFYMHGQGDFKGCTMLTTVPWNFSNFLKSTDPATAISFSSTGTFLLNSTFEDCTSFDSWIGWNVSDCTSMNSTFKNTQWTPGKQNCLGNWNVSNVTDMTSLFEGSNYTDQYISKWKGKINKVKSMAKMFRNCEFDSNIDGWFKSANNPNPVIVNMSGMFSGAACKFGTRKSPEAKNAGKKLNQWQKLTTVEDVSDMFRDNKHCDDWYSWFHKTPGVTYAVKDMSGMFAGTDCAFFTKHWTSKMLQSWDMRSVEDVSEMLKDNKNIDRDYSAWFKKESGVTYSIKNMSGLFSGACTYGIKASAKGIENWDMSTVENISEMFKGNQYFDYDLSKWFEADGTNYVVSDMSGLFEGAKYGKAMKTYGKKNLIKWNMGYNVTEIHEWDMSSVESTARMFKDNQNYTCSLYKLLDDSPTGGVSIKNISGMFENSVFTYSLPWKLNTCEDISRCFAGTAAFNGDITGWFNNTTKSANLKNISSLFEGNTTYNTEGIKHWKLPMVENASGMFKDSTYNKSLWGISLPAATDTSSMFENSQFRWSLSTLSLKSVIDASYMFRNSAYDKKSSHFFPTGSKIKYMTGMFSGENCQFGAGGDPKISGWKTDTAVDMSEMFKENEHYNYWLGPVNGFGWNVSNVQKHHDFKTKADWTAIPNFTATSVTHDPAKPFGMFDLMSMTSLSGRVTLAGTGVFDELTLTSPATDIPGAVDLTAPANGSVSLEVTSTNLIDWTYTPDHTVNPGPDPFTINYTDCNKNEVAIPVDMGTWKPVVYTDPTASVSIDDSGWNLYNAPMGIMVGRGVDMTVTNNKATLESEGQVFSEEFVWQIGTKDSNNNYTWTDLNQPVYADTIVLYPGTTYTGTGKYLNCVYRVYGQDGRVAVSELATKPSLDYITYTESEVTSVAIDNLPVNGLPTGTSTTLSVGTIVSNRADLVAEGQTVSDVYKWYINNVEVGDQQTLTITGDGGGATGVSNNYTIRLDYELVSPVPGTDATGSASHNVLVEPVLGITSVTLSANHDALQGDETVHDGDTYTVNAVVDANGSVGHADPSKAVNADSETYLWESNDGSGWSPAAGVNNQSSYSFVADYAAGTPGVLRVTYTITNESDTASLTSSPGSNIVLLPQPSPYDYTVELENVGTPANPEYVVKVGAGQYPNPQSAWDETDTMYDTINPGGANNPSAPVTKTIDLTQPAGLGKNLGLTIDPRGFNGDYTGVTEYTNGVTIVNDILTIEIDPENTPSLWLYDKAATTELEPSNDRGIKGKYFYHVPWQDASGEDTRGFMPSMTFTGDTTGPYDSGEVDIDVSISLDVDFWLNDVSIGGNATTLAGMTQDGYPAGVWTKADNGQHVLNFSFKYMPDAADEPNQDFEFTVYLNSGDGDSNTGSSYQVTASLGPINISAGNSWVWNTFATGSSVSYDYIHLYLRSLPDDTLPNGGGNPGSPTQYTPEAIKTYLNGSIPAINNPSSGHSTDLNPFGTWELADHDISVPLIPDNNGNLSTVTVPAGKWYYRKGHDGSLGNKHLAIFQYPQDSTGQWKPGTGGYRAFSMWEINPDTSTYYNMLEFGPELGGQGNYTGHSIIETNNNMPASYSNVGWTPPTIPSGVQAGWKYVITTPDPTDPTDYNKALYGYWGDGKYEGCITTGNVNHDPLADYQSSTLACIPEVLGCTDPLASNYNAAANTDDGTCTYNNAWSNLPATVDMDWADPMAGNFGYTSMPITFTKNPNQSTTETFKDEMGTDFTTNLFYTGTFSVYGANYIGYLAFSDTYDGYGNGTPVESWHAGDDGGTGSYTTPDFSSNGIGMTISSNWRNRTSPAGNYEGDPSSPYHQATVT